MNHRVVQPKQPEVAGEQFLPSLLAGTAICAGKAGADRRQALARLDAAKQLVSVARAAADQSLLRAKSAPRPHEITNPAFVEKFEAHQRDREVLFAAMRTLESVRSAIETG